MARQVTTLYLRPVNYVAADQVEPWTSLWLITAPTFWSVLKHFEWSHPILSWRYYRQSRESIRVSTKVVPLLTHLREISVMPHVLRLKPPPLEPYRAICAGFKTEHLQRLNFQLGTPEAIQVASEAMKRTPPVVFRSLQTLTLDLGMGHNMYPKLQEDLRSILDCGRASIRTFAIIVNPTNNYFANVVGAFGIFPNLVQFHFEAALLRYDEDDQLLGRHFLPFFLNHRSTLTKLHLSVLPISSSIIRSIAGHDDDHNPPPRLEALTLGYHLNPFDGIRLPSFRRFADTLTCLMLVSTFESGGFSYDDLKGLFDNLRLPAHGIGLKRLWVHVLTLSPELLDLMADSLTNLEKLRLSYGKLVGNKDQQLDNKVSSFIS